MLKNYLKVAWRNLTRNKGLSFINISGLAIGMAFAMLIGLWIQYEMSFDKFHVKEKQLAIVRKNTLFNNEKGTQVAVPLPLAPALKNNYPEVTHASRLSWADWHSLMVGDKKLNRPGYHVDPDFLEMFTFPLLRGDIKTALNDPYSIIISSSLATALFGTDDAMGKTIRYNNEHNLKVSGILKDVPKNSFFEFDFLAPYVFKEHTERFVKNNLDNWRNNSLMTVVELKEGVSMDDFSKKIGPLATGPKGELKNQAFFLQPIGEMHLHDEYKDWKNTGGRIEYVRLFGIIGIFVLLIACINFMNLATARSEKRAKEVGIRKAVGSHRRQLITQFLGESMFTAFIAFALSLLIVQLVLPFLKNIGFENVRFDFGNIALLASVLVICILTGLIAGSYPAIYLSSFTPVKVLKGFFQRGKGAGRFRKTLVVIQFAISIGLITSTIIVFQQIENAKKRSIGYDVSNLISLNTSRDLEKNYAAVKQELLNTGKIEAVTRSSSPLTDTYNSWDDFSWEGKAAGSDISINVIMTEWDYEKATGMKFIEGRAFSRDHPTDSNAVILNEAALKMIGYKDPIGKTMKLGNQVITIVGVIEDMLIESPFRPIAPTVILFNVNSISNILIRLKPSADLKATLAVMKSIVEKYNPSQTFDYSFADEDFSKKFATENQVGKLAGIFAGLAIFISCLGLFGLAAFMAERRIKEIGIRKVLGASVANLWILLSKEFIILVMIACIIASPLAFWFMNDWLQNYDYRINISAWVFVIAGIIAMIVALITVSTQAIKAAVANPVKSLRTE